MEVVGSLITPVMVLLIMTLVFERFITAWTSIAELIGRAYE
jgi:branched-subunit amino acid permease